MFAHIRVRLVKDPVLRQVICKLVLVLLLVGAVSVPLMIRSCYTYTAARADTETQLLIDPASVNKNPSDCRFHLHCKR